MLWLQRQESYCEGREMDRRESWRAFYICFHTFPPSFPKIPVQDSDWTCDIGEVGINQRHQWSWIPEVSLKWTLPVQYFAKKRIRWIRMSRNYLKDHFWSGTTKFTLIFPLNTSLSALSLAHWPSLANCSPCALIPLVAEDLLIGCSCFTVIMFRAVLTQTNSLVSLLHLWSHVVACPPQNTDLCNLGQTGSISPLIFTNQ